MRGWRGRAGKNQRFERVVFELQMGAGGLGGLKRVVRLLIRRARGGRSVCVEEMGRLTD